MKITDVAEAGIQKNPHNIDIHYLKTCDRSPVNGAGSEGILKNARAGITVFQIYFIA
jgi:hypothetical protein